MEFETPGIHTQTAVPHRSDVRRQSDHTLDERRAQRCHLERHDLAVMREPPARDIEAEHAPWERKLTHEESLADPKGRLHATGDNLPRIAYEYEEGDIDKQELQR